MTLPIKDFKRIGMLEIPIQKRPEIGLSVEGSFSKICEE